MALAVRILGNLEALVDGAPVGLGGSRQRRLLALLVLAAGRPLSAVAIADRLWPDDLPKAATKNVQVYVARLRASLGAESGRLATTAAGYELHLAPDELDATRFESLVQTGRAAQAAGDASTARRALGEALDLWRGPALGDAADEPFARPHVERLDELRRAARDDLLELRVEAGDPTVIGDLRAITHEDPARERPWRLLMRALYAYGRDAEALAAYHEVRRHLRDELGLDPSDELVALERAILTRTLGRRPGHPSADVDAPARAAAGVPVAPEAATAPPAGTIAPRAMDPGDPSGRGTARRRRPLRRHRLVLAIGLVAAVLVGGAAAMGRLAPAPSQGAAGAVPVPGTMPAGVPGQTASPTSADVTPASSAGVSRPAAYPSDAEAALLAELPPALAATCVRGATPDDARLAGWIGRAPTAVAGNPPQPIGWTEIVPPAPVAGLTCRPVTGAARVYLQAHRVEGGTDPTAIAATALSLFEGRWNVEEGRCGEIDRAAEPWESARGEGTVVCLRRHPHDGRPWVLWTFAGGRAIGFATRDDTDFERLLDWWRTTATLLR